MRVDSRTYNNNNNKEKNKRARKNRQSFVIHWIEIIVHENGCKRVTKDIEEYVRS